MLLRRISIHIRNQNWAAVILDFVVVVFGIFIGLQVNNWNEARKDRIKEDALLVALASDFDEAAQQLAAVRRNHQTVAEAGQDILTYGEVGFVPEGERSRFELLLSRHGARFIFTPPMGTVESLLGTDRITLIRNQELIAQLTQWPQLVASLNETEVAARDHFHERLFPYLASRLDFEDMDKGFVECCFTAPDLIFRIEYPWEQKPTDAYLLAQDIEFLNLIYWHWVHSMNKLQTLWLIEDSLAAIQRLVEEEMRR